MARTKIVKVNGLSREKWLEIRRGYIGGSDAAAIVGLNEYSTPYAVWADKTGRLPPKDDNEALRQGRDFEAYVARRFEEKTGKKVMRSPYMWGNTKYPFASANIDRDVVGEDAGLEIKTTSVLNLKKFKDGDFPLTYYCQCVHYLAVTEKQRWYLAVLVLNQGFMVYQLTRVPDDAVPEWCSGSVYISDDEISALMDAEREFWRFVENDTPPDFSGTQADTAALSAVYPQGKADETLELSDRDLTVSRYLSIKNSIKELEAELEQCEQVLKGDLGDYERAQAGNYLVTWKTQSRRNFDVKKYSQDHPDLDLSGYFEVSTFRKFDVKSFD